VTSNPEDLKRTLSLTSTVLNRVNCSSAPDCESLNRLSCSSMLTVAVEGTCGECMIGFVGLLGSSNTLCLSLSEVRRRLLLLPSSAARMSCVSDADCAEEGLFIECNLQSKLCQSIQQSCPNACSGHGRCVFVSKYDANVSVSECGVLDVDCVPRCDCEAAYMGSSSCWLRAEEVLRAREVRHLIVEGVGELMSRENAGAGNVQSWMQTLSLVGSDYQTLSGESKRLMVVLVIDIFRVSRELGISIEDLSGMEKVVDLCVSGLSGSSSQFLDSGDVSLLVSLIEAYSDFVTADMLEAQDAVSSVTGTFRSSSFYLPYSAALSSSLLTLSIPESQLELFARSSNSLSASASSQLSIELPSDLVFPLRISLSETLTRSSTIERPRNETNSGEIVYESILSLPLFVSLGSSPCNASGPACLVKVKLQHKPGLASLLPTFPSNITSFEVDCVAGVPENHSFECPSGDVVTIICNGSSSPLRGHLSCPMISSSVGCQARVQSSRFHSSSSPSDIPCKLSDYSPSMSVCVCNLSAIGVDVTGEGGPVSFSILSVERSVLRDFVSTWETVPSLSTGDAAGSWVVLMTLGGLGGVFGLMMAFGIYFDASERKSRQSASVAPLLVAGGGGSASESQIQQVGGSRWFSVGVSPDPRDIASPPARSTEEVPVNLDLQLLEESLPLIFQSKSLWTKFKEEMRVYHRWLGIVLYYSPEFPRSMRVLSLFSSIVIMLFVQSVTYNIADPDDGSCEARKGESQCLSLRSTLNARESRCYWQVEFSETESRSVLGSCHFREIGGDMARMFIVALISAIVSAPFALSVQSLIVNVLSKEAIEEEELEKEKKKLYEASIRRTQSLRLREATLLADLVRSGGGPSDNDLKNLQTDLMEFYKDLKMNNEGRVSAKEFRGECLATPPPALC
jgi:hypothetical protein